MSILFSFILLMADVALTKVIDTLGTNVPGVKVVLYEDNTWGYLRDKSSADIVLPEGWSAAPLLLAEDSLHFCIPAMGRFNSPFGKRYGRQHTGVDISLTPGTPVRAAFDGTVRISGSMGGYGLVVTIIHYNGLETFYAHLSRLNVGVGYPVLAGDIIGYSGNTGRSTGPHLHFETRFKGQPFDPERIFDFSTGELRSRMFTLKRPYLCITSNYSKDYNKDLFEEMPKEAKPAPSGNTSKAEAAGKAETAPAGQKDAQNPIIVPQYEEGVPVYHTIENGDNLSRLAKKYNTTVGEICKLNNKITPNTVLQLGWEVRVR